MSQENKERNQLAEIELKNLVFANNPQLYAEMYKDIVPDIEEDDVDWLVPSSEDDIESALQEMKELGLFPGG